MSKVQIKMSLFSINYTVEKKFLNLFIYLFITMPHILKRKKYKEKLNKKNWLEVNCGKLSSSDWAYIKLYRSFSTSEAHLL